MKYPHKIIINTSIILSFLVILTLITVFIIFKYLPSTIQLNINKYGVVINAVGGAALFLIIFNVYSKSFQKISKLLISIFSFIIFFMVGSIVLNSSAQISNNNIMLQQASESEIEYHDTIEIMERLKTDIEKHYGIYKCALNSNRSILDKKVAKTAAERCLKQAEVLFALSEKALDNENIIMNVSGLKTTYLEYKNFAREIINKFEM